MLLLTKENLQTFKEVTLNWIIGVTELVCMLQSKVPSVTCLLFIRTSDRPSDHTAATLTQISKL